MKKITVFTFLFFSHISWSQVFNGGGGAIQNAGEPTYFPLSVSGLGPGKPDSLYGLEEICFSITHPKVEELDIYLVSPAGRTVQICGSSSCRGVDFTSTCFNSSASVPITNATAPYTGTFRPLGYLGRFNTGQSGNGMWNLIVKDWMAFVNSGSLISWSIKFGNSPGKPVTLSASTLPIVVINTNNQIIGNDRKIVDLGIIYNGAGQVNHISDPRNNYNGKTEIHLRGHTSKNFEKKSYSLELKNSAGITIDAPLLGMPPESDWCLIAEYQDKSLTRIPLTYHLSRKMGNYAPRLKNVEVILNGEYIGVYAFVEKIKRGVDRVNIRKLSDYENSMPFISGGYILKIDRTDAAGWPSLLSGNSANGSHFYYQFDEPKDTVITPQQTTYIKGYCNEFETAMNSPDYKDPVKGYQKYIDVSSFVDFFIINEMSKNVDAYRLSTFLYKDDLAKGGKLHIGPIWDYDLAWHNCDYGNAFDPSGWQYEIMDNNFPSPTWWNRLMLDTTFVNKVHCRWKSLRQNVLASNELYEYIDSSAAAINEPQKRNFSQWPLIGAYIFPNPQNQTNATYASEIADLKTWVNNRFGWLDGFLPGSCKTLGVDEYGREKNVVTLYPNPVGSSAAIKMHLTAEAMVSLSIMDAFGSTVLSFPENLVAGGDPQIEFNCNGLRAGVYFYRLKINQTTYAGKMIVK